jgi:hypothetical protein
MASGLIPIVPTIGGSSEFVPSEYQYHTIQQAADIISNILNDDVVLVRDKISNIVSKFSIQTYKKNLNNIIDYVIKGRKVEEAVILNKTRTRLSASPGVSHTGGAEPRTRIVAVVTRVAKVFFIDISSDNSKPPSQVAPKFPHIVIV